MARLNDVDVAIVGGGPAGSTTAAMIKKYAPELEVAVFEREQFPREHVGESLLPSACKVLAEMGCWDAVEAAGFPVKIGATYRWGSSPKLWDFEFVPSTVYQSVPRPSQFAGQRAQTAFQVDRSIFDKILLEHAESLGAHVHMPRPVKKVQREGDRVTALELDSGERVEAKIYVDASGGAGILRRAMEVEVDEPTALKNVAFWDYWENTEWAVSIGTDATRVLVLSIAWGWIWFIPVGPCRTSIGLVCPAAYYKQSGISSRDLYDKALSQEPKIQELLQGASREGEVRGTKDWSFLASRVCGENWYLAGESAGFADPILSAGISLTMTGARELAYTIAAAHGGEDKAWLNLNYDQNQRARIRQHIRFADFWYSGNGQFSDLKEFTKTIAEDSGLRLSADEAFQWLGTGGFANDISLLPTLADVSIDGVKQLTQRFTESSASWKLQDFNVLKLNLKDAKKSSRPSYQMGKVVKIPTFERDGKILPILGLYGIVLKILEKETKLTAIVKSMREHASGPRDPVPYLFQVLEVWLADGWIVGEAQAGLPFYKFEVAHDRGAIHDNLDIAGA